jgi:hypothetical protein
MGRSNWRAVALLLSSTWSVEAVSMGRMEANGGRNGRRFM